MKRSCGRDTGKLTTTAAGVVRGQQVGAAGRRRHEDARHADKGLAGGGAAAHGERCSKY
jgi:hypothetical protein